MPHHHYPTNPRRWVYLGLLAVCVAAGDAQAQSTLTFDPYTREPLPANAPTWMREIVDDPSGVSYRRMDSLFNDWLAQDINARVKTLDKKPAVNFYRRWMKAYRPFVGGDGRIHLPTMEEHNALLERQNRQSEQRRSRAAGQPIWRNIGPNTTEREAGKGKDNQACVYRLTVSPKDPKIVYAGTETGVIFKTTDKGLTWKPCNALHNFGGPIFALQVDPQNPEVVYAGGGQNFWKSTNGGDTWTMVPGIVMRVNSIRIHPTNSQIVTIGNGDSRGKNTQQSGFYVSKDGGQTFNQTFNAVVQDHELQPGNPDRIYMIAKLQEEVTFGFYVSENGGQSFTKVEMPVKDIAAGRLAVSEAPNGQNHVYALVTSDFWGSGNGPYGGLGKPHILQSKDAGLTWTDQTTRDGRNTTFSGFADEPFNGRAGGGQGYFDMMVGASSTDPEHVIYGLCNAYRSTEGGKGLAWSTGIGGYVNRDNMHPDMQDIVVCGNDTWISTDGGIKYSDNFFKTPGEDRNFGIYASDYHGFGQGWNDDVMAGGRWHNGNAVMRDTYGEGNSLHVSGVEQATGYVMLSNSNKVYFSDGGMTTIPTDIKGKVEIDYKPFQFKKPMESIMTNKELGFDPRYAQRVILSSGDYQEFGKLFVSEDEGLSFRELFDSEGEFIIAYDIARSNPDHIYVVFQHRIRHSNDNGATWTEFISNPYGEHELTGATISVDPHDHTKLWYSNHFQKGQVAYTTNNGATWVYPFQGKGMDSRTFTWILPTGNEKNGVYFCTSDESKIYYQEDGTDLIDYSAGFPPGARITRIVPFYKEGKLRIASDQGIWEAPLHRPMFKPVAQPIALNLGNGDLSSNPNKEVHFDSYSIVNQNDVKWEWSFWPKPQKVEGADTRNPKVVFGQKGAYAVTLKVTTPQGSHTRTIREMIRINVPTSISSSTMPQLETTIRYEGGLPILVVQSGQLKEKKTFTLHNVKGMQLLLVDIPAEETHTEIPLHPWEKGVYLYRLLTKHHKFFGKFIRH